MRLIFYRWIKIVFSSTHSIYLQQKLLKCLPHFTRLLPRIPTDTESRTPESDMEGIFRDTFRKHKPHTSENFVIIFHLICFSFHFSFVLARLALFFPLASFVAAAFNSILYAINCTRWCGRLNKFISIFIQYEFLSMILYKIMYEWISE